LYNIFKNLLNSFFAKEIKNNKSLLLEHIKNNFENNLLFTKTNSQSSKLDIKTSILARPNFDKKKTNLISTSKIESLRKSSKSQIKTQDCGYDITTFIFAANRWHPAKVKVIIADSILLFEVNKFGEMNLCFKKISINESEEVYNILVKKQMSLYFDKNKFNSEWISNPFNVIPFEGKLKEAIISIANT